MRAETSNLLEEYRAVRERAGLLVFPQRGKIRVSGPDRLTFLQAMISNDVERLEERSGCEATFLTARGKMVCWFNVYKLGDHFLLDLSGGNAVDVIAAFEKFIIMDDVRLEDTTEQWAHLSIQGPQASGFLHPFFDNDLPSGMSMRALEFDDSSGWLISNDRYGLSGWDLLFEPATAARISSRLQDAGLPLLHPDAEEILRIEAGLPRWDVDINSSNNPLEARLNDAISLTKGCYSGQEVISKATHVGGVGRFLMGFELSGDVVPAPGAAITDDGGEKLGQVTSAVYSPSRKCPIGLGYIRRAAAKPGQRVLVELPAREPAAGQIVAHFSS